MNDVKRFARAVFRAILFGGDELINAVPPPVPSRTYLDDPIMLAQRRNADRRNPIRHGPIVRGVLQPIRKLFDSRRLRWVTNER